MSRKATGDIINEIWAYISVDEDGDEGICAYYNTSMGSWMPMVGADEARMTSLRDIAEGLASAGAPRAEIRLVRFAAPRETIEVIRPREEK